MVLRRELARCRRFAQTQNGARVAPSGCRGKSGSVELELKLRLAALVRLVTVLDGDYPPMLALKYRFEVAIKELAMGW